MPTYTDHLPIRSGGSARVISCRDGDGKLYAKKILTAAQLANRFKEEVRILSNLDHPNVVKIIFAQLADQPPWFIMPYYKTTLDDELTDVIGNADRIQKIFASILTAVEYAHREGVIHRDMKPSNVLLNNDDDVVVSDFGIGRALDATGDRLTFTGQQMGTRLYMSPEQVSDSKSVDWRTDIYSLGRMLYELHTERLTVVVQQLDRVPSRIAPIIERCTQHDREKRFQSVSDLKEAWRRAVSSAQNDGPLSEATLLLSELNATPRMAGKVETLANLLQAHGSDGDIVREVMMQLPVESFEILERTKKDATRTVVIHFVEHILSQTWGLTFVDRVGNRCGDLFIACRDGNMRGELMKCVVVLGCTFKRYTLFEILAHLAHSVTDLDARREICAKLSLVPANQRHEVGKWIDLSDMHPDLSRLFRP